VLYGENKMDIEEIANAACENLIPPKSQKRYEDTYTCFKYWMRRKKATEVTENVCNLLFIFIIFCLNFIFEYLRYFKLPLNAI
jgi:hypothetical protein